MENLRQRTSRQVEQANKFAVQVRASRFPTSDGACRCTAPVPRATAPLAAHKVGRGLATPRRAPHPWPVAGCCRGASSRRHGVSCLAALWRAGLCQGDAGRGRQPAASSGGGAGRGAGRGGRCGPRARPAPAARPAGGCAADQQCPPPGGVPPWQRRAVGWAGRPRPSSCDLRAGRDPAEQAPLIAAPPLCLRPQALKQNGVEQFDPTGSKFDPNLHNAMFEVPDPSKEAGTVAVVTKVGACSLLAPRVMGLRGCGSSSGGSKGAAAPSPVAHPGSALCGCALHQSSTQGLMLYLPCVFARRAADPSSILVVPAARLHTPRPCAAGRRVWRGARRLMRASINPCAAKILGSRPVVMRTLGALLGSDPNPSATVCVLCAAVHFSRPLPKGAPSSCRPSIFGLCVLRPVYTHHARAGAARGSAAAQHDLVARSSSAGCPPRKHQDRVYQHPHAMRMRGQQAVPGVDHAPAQAAKPVTEDAGVVRYVQLLRWGAHASIHSVE